METGQIPLSTIFKVRGQIFLFPPAPEINWFCDVIGSFFPLTSVIFYDASIILAFETVSMKIPHGDYRSVPL